MRLYCFFAAVLLAACGLAGPRVAATPTLDAARWSVYQDLDHHFSFVYPKAYETRSLCALKVKRADLSSPDFSVSLSNSDLKINLSPLADPQATDPNAAVQALRDFWIPTQRVSFDDPVKRTVAGLPALSQRYKTVYSGDGYQESTFFIKNGVLYTISLNTPATCDGYPDTPTAVEAYQRILESFTIQ